MEEKKSQGYGIDYQRVFREIIKRKRLFVKTLPLAFVLSCIYIFSLPRYYDTDTMLAPETENPMSGGTIGSIASTFGLDLGNMQSSDAITPLLYPNLMEDNGFVTNMFNIQVATKDGEIKTNYHDYLKKYQKNAWWNIILGAMKNWFSKKEEPGKGKMDPYFVCKTIADSVKFRLQDFITTYRTNKARTDYEYYKELAAQAKKDYEKSRQLYAGYSDANTHIALKSVELKAEEMENDMQLKFNAYSTINTQLQAAKAKVQERTPAFTTLKGAAVPIKPAGPKRMLFVFLMLILTFMGTCGYILYDIVKPESALDKNH